MNPAVQAEKPCDFHSGGRRCQRPGRVFVYKSCKHDWRPRVMCKMHVNNAKPGRIMTVEEHTVWMVMTS